MSATLGTQENCLGEVEKSDLFVTKTNRNMSDSDEVDACHETLPDGLFVVPSFLSKQDIQIILDTIHLNENNWFYDGFEKPRRVQHYSTLNNPDEGIPKRKRLYCDLSSLDWLIHKFMDSANSYSAQQKSERLFHRPMEIMIEERYPNSYSKTVTPVENLALSCFECNVSSECLCQQAHHAYSNTHDFTDNQDNANLFFTNHDTLCHCYVAYIALLQPCTHYMNKPKERNIECWELETSDRKNPLNLHLECNSLVVKTGESLWNWRYRLIPISNNNKAKNLGDQDESPRADNMNNTPMYIIKFKCMNLPPKKTVDKIIMNGRYSGPSDGVNSTIPNTWIENRGENTQQLNLADLLTIVITTSPIKSHPSTELLERTFDTFPLAGNDFAYKCQKIIICDGCRVLTDDDDVDLEGFDENSNGNRSVESEDVCIRTAPRSTNNKKERKISRKYSNVKQSLRNGIVTNEQAENYEKFKIALRALCLKASREKSENTFQNTKIVELQDRHGYGFALRHAVRYEVSTPFVCVIQHDRTFMRKTPIHEVVQVMVNDRQEKVKYIGLSQRSNLMYRDIIISKYGKFVAKDLCDLVLLPPEIEVDEEDFQSSMRDIQGYHTESLRSNLFQLSHTYRGSFQYTSHLDMMKERAENRYREDDTGSPSTTDGLMTTSRRSCSLTPTLFWYDNIHICRTLCYRDFIFDTRYRMVAKGGFVEDRLSPAIIRNVERLGLSDGHAKFGCYLLDDHSGFFFTGHLDGGSFIAQSSWKDQKLVQKS